MTSTLLAVDVIDKRTVSAIAVVHFDRAKALHHALDSLISVSWVPLDLLDRMQGRPNLDAIAKWGMENDLGASLRRQDRQSIKDAKVHLRLRTANAWSTELWVVERELNALRRVMKPQDLFSLSDVRSLETIQKISSTTAYIYNSVMANKPRPEAMHRLVVDALGRMQALVLVDRFIQQKFPAAYYEDPFSAAGARILEEQIQELNDLYEKGAVLAKSSTI